ncbi:Sacsin [Phytophthora nicotianae]|uniref:Sacsin n=1 Tax=Phytophthora nicotianae TaxID=4792 RepID=A0A0W8CZ93_PHYNI|nr:Sacsin [Phytophthora nicotianae]
MQQQLLPPDATLPTFVSDSPIQPPQQSDDLARPAASSTSGLPLGRRMRLTLGQKREVVDLAASKKFTHRELAEKFRVGRTTITNICRQEDLIRTETDSADATKKKRKTTKCTYDLRVLDECLHKWRMEVKVSSPDTKLTGTVLQHKAMELACKIVQEPYAALPDKVKQALQKFTGSNGWLDGYRTRFGSFSSKQLPGGGDQSVIKSVDIQTRLRELHHAFNNVDIEDIWTGSEFAIMYKPPVSESVSGNGNNGRYTVSLFVSAAGEKHDLQVIGTDRNPLLLEGIDTKETFNIQYGYSKTGWQVAQTTQQLSSIAQLAPDFLRWIGVTEPANAQVFVDLEGNASVTDPGIDEVQIIRGVLQKHGYLSTKRLDDESHANGPYETFEDVADEPCPRPEEVLASIGILKRYLRLSRDAIPNRVDAIVQLNDVKKAVDGAAFRDAAI